MRKNLIKEACLLGTVAGMRSMLPLAVMSLSARKQRWLAFPAGALAAGELVYDKLPQAEDRTKPTGLIARLATATLAGGIAARRLRGSIAIGAGVGALAALASTYLFHWLRGKAGRRVPPAASGVGEDLLAVGASACALKSL
jgi:uncharacterized membrane protein